MNYNSDSYFSVKERERLREELQLLFDRSFRENDLNLLRSQYRILRALEFATGLDYIPEKIDISSLCRNITSACDILARDNDCNFIYCGNDTAPILGNTRLVTKAVLNLLSNAYLYGTEKLITVKTLEEQEIIKIEVQSGGTFQSTANEGKGLAFVRRVCDKMNGRFFVETDADYSRAIMIFNKNIGSPALDTRQIDFHYLINDRLSPIYIEMYGMQYH